MNYCKESQTTIKQTSIHMSRLLQFQVMMEKEINIGIHPDIQMQSWRKVLWNSPSLHPQEHVFCREALCNERSSRLCRYFMLCGPTPLLVLCIPIWLFIWLLWFWTSWSLQALCISQAKGMAFISVISTTSLTSQSNACLSACGRTWPGDLLRVRPW